MTNTADVSRKTPSVDRDTFARTLALTDDYDGCFERLDAWAAATEDARQCGEVEEPLSADEEDAEFWLRRADAVMPLVVQAQAQAIRDFAAWLRETYPKDVYGTLDGLANEAINDAIRSAGHTRDAVSADMMRRTAAIADRHADDLETGDRP